MKNPALLTIKKIKNSAKRLKTIINEIEKPINYNQALQIQSQSLFAKSYEEIKETILKEKTENTYNQPVFIFVYQSESIVVFNEEYVTQTNIGTESEISYKSLYSMAESLAAINNTSVVKNSLPHVLNEDWEVEDVILLAKKMHFFNQHNIFLELESDCKIFINDMHCPYALNGDWESEIEDNEDGENMCVWYPEMTHFDSFYEFFISFKDLCDAVYSDGTWLILQNNETIAIEITK